MPQFTIYQSTDPSAPVLSGQSGALITLLDAILVNGYGAKSAAGWSKPFTGSSTKEVYRPASGTRFYLRVLDDGSMTGSFRDTSVRAGESMSDIDTFTNPFPTAAQASTGVNWRKSTTANSTARPWIAFADDRTFHLFVLTGDVSNAYFFMSFGDFYSYNPSDTYNCALIGTEAFTASAHAAGAHHGDLITVYNFSSSSLGSFGHYIARMSTGTGSSHKFYKKGLGTFGGSGATTISLLGVMAYPNTADGGLWMSPIMIIDNSVPDVVHGELRGMYHQAHAISNFSDGDTLSGAGDYTGRSFYIVKQSPNSGVYTVETSNTLNTN